MFSPPQASAPSLKTAPKQTIDGRDYLLMKPIHADFAVICGAKIDKAGNVWYKGNTSNFNLVMATAADTVIAEAEEIVEIGEIEPENVRTYGVFVDYVVEGVHRSACCKRT